MSWRPAELISTVELHTAHILGILGTRKSVRTMQSMCRVWVEHGGLRCTIGCAFPLPKVARVSEDCARAEPAIFAIYVQSSKVEPVRIAARRRWDTLLSDAIARSAEPKKRHGSRYVFRG